MDKHRKKFRRTKQAIKIVLDSHKFPAFVRQFFRQLEQKKLFVKSEADMLRSSE